MKKNIEILLRIPLFLNIQETELESLLKCLKVKEKTYEKEEYIFTAGQPIHELGIVLSGSVNIIKEDYWGNRTILTMISVGELFGESFACVDIEFLPVSAVTNEKSEILFIDFKNIMSSCADSCEYHNLLIFNMVRIMAGKNILLMQKMEHITKRNTRDKILSYLSARAQQENKNQFKIPYNRQEMADYLSVDRSAMSNELCRLRDEGILEFHKNEFIIKNLND